MEQCHHRCDGELGLEADGHVDHYDAQCHQQAQPATFCQFLADTRADEFQPVDLRLHATGLGQHREDALAERHQLIGHLDFTDAFIHRQPDQHILIGTEGDHLRRRVAVVAQRRRDLLNDDGFRVTNFHQGAAGEVEAELQRIDCQ